MPLYHVEIRKFPKTMTLFNQTGTQIGSIVLPWVQERIVEVDGEKWAPYETSLTILEGPEIPLERRTMGRGWRVAQKQSVDVTERILAEARQALASGSVGGAPAELASELGSAPEAQSDVEASRPDPATAELATLLGIDALRLLALWREVAGRSTGLVPSESLALAERELRRSSDR